MFQTTNQFWYPVIHIQLPSGKLTEVWLKSPFLMGKLTIKYPFSYLIFPLLLIYTLLTTIKITIFISWRYPDGTGDSRHVYQLTRSTRSAAWLDLRGAWCHQCDPLCTPGLGKKNGWKIIGKPSFPMGFPIGFFLILDVLVDFLFCFSGFCGCLIGFSWICALNLLKQLSKLLPWAPNCQDL